MNIPFGLKKGLLFEPRQVPLGKSCGCVCPSCNKPLVSKHAIKGGVRPHFSHQTKIGCEYGKESAIHLAAKQLISEHLKVFLPELIVKSNAIDALGKEHFLEKKLLSGGTRNLLSVRVEKSLTDFRPDIIATTMNSKELVIEIAFTHYVDEVKLNKIENKGIRAIEIDVSTLTLLNFDSLAKLLFEPSNYVRWIFHPEINPTKLTLLDQLKPILKTAQNSADSYLKKLKEKAEKKELKDKALMEAVLERKRENKQNSEDRKEKFKAMNSQEKLVFSLGLLNISENEIPDFLNFKVRGEHTLKIPRKIWQVSVFAAFIQHINNKFIPNQFNVTTITNWLEERFEIKQDPKFINATKIAVWDFLENLSILGILLHEGRQRFSVLENDLIKIIKENRASCFKLDVLNLTDDQLVWADKWPDKNKVIKVGSIYEKKFRGLGFWNDVINLIPEAKIRRPKDIAKHYSMKKDGAEDIVLRFLIESEFVKITM